ncbi:MAG: putative nuclease with TOPRIM domain [Saprospiraceae bacterium]|jgi:predicted nuclease with TOPRIM domain
MSGRVISGIIIALLLMLSGYLWYENGQLKNAHQEKIVEFSELQSVQEELDSDYQEALESIEGLRTDSQELNALIDNQKEELKAQKTKINNLIWTKRELNTAREEISKFESLTAGYLAQISDLTAKNEMLQGENNKLIKDVLVLNQDLTAEKEVSADLEEARTVLVSEKEDLQTFNQKLSDKVEIGSAIKINYISFEGGSVNDDGSWKRRKLNKRMDVMRTCFRTETNVVVPAGEETFYVRLINTNGETVMDDDLDSGEITNKLTGETIRYTMSGTLTYNNEDTEACMDWNPDGVIEKGTYGVAIFNKGYQVGSGTFEL